VVTSALWLMVQDNSVNYTTLLWLDTQRGVSRVDSINYDDSFPQRLTDMFMCMVRSLAGCRLGHRGSLLLGVAGWTLRDV